MDNKRNWRIPASIGVEMGSPIWVLDERKRTNLMDYGRTMRRIDLELQDIKFEMEKTQMPIACKRRQGRIIDERERGIEWPIQIRNREVEVQIWSFTSRGGNIDWRVNNEKPVTSINWRCSTMDELAATWIGTLRCPDLETGGSSPCIGWV